MWTFKMLAFMAGPKLIQDNKLLTFSFLSCHTCSSSCVKPLTRRTPDSGRQLTAPLFKGVPGVGCPEGDKLIPSLSTCMGRKSQSCGFGWKGTTANKGFGLTSSQSQFRYLKLVVVSRVGQERFLPLVVRGSSVYHQTNLYRSLHHD
jgi:hypothetical protein